MKTKLILCCLALACGVGCTTIAYTSPSCEKLTRTSFLSNIKAGKVIIVKPDGTRVELENYGGDTISGAAMITEAAVRGAVNGAK